MFVCSRVRPLCLSLLLSALAVPALAAEDCGPNLLSRRDDPDVERLIGHAPARRDKMLDQLLYASGPRRRAGLELGRRVWRRLGPATEATRAWFLHASNDPSFRLTEDEARWLGPEFLDEICDRAAGLGQIESLFDLAERLGATETQLSRLGIATTKKFGAVGFELATLHIPGRTHALRIFKSLFDAGTKIKSREVEIILGHLDLLDVEDRREIYELALATRRLLGPVSRYLMAKESREYVRDFCARLPLGDLLRIEPALPAPIDASVWLAHLRRLQSSVTDHRKLALEILTATRGRVTGVAEQIDLFAAVLKVADRRDLRPLHFSGRNLSDEDLLKIIAPRSAQDGGGTSRFAKVGHLLGKLLPEQALRLALGRSATAAISKASPSGILDPVEFQARHPRALGAAELAWANQPSLTRERVMARISFLVRGRPGIDEVLTAEELTPGRLEELARTICTTRVREIIDRFRHDFGEVTEVERRRLREIQGSRQVEGATRGFTRARAEMKEFIASLPEINLTVFGRLLDSVDVMDFDDVQLMRAQAVDVLGLLESDRALSARFLPLRLQTHNLPDRTLLADVREFEAELRRRNISAEAIDLTHALADSIARFLERVSARPGPESTTTIAPLLEIEEMVKTLANDPTRADLETRVMYSLAKHPFDPSDSVDTRRRWARLMIELFHGLGWIETMVKEDLLGGGLDRADTAAISHVLIALEDRLHRSLRQWVSARGADAFFEDTVRGSLLIGLSNVVRAYGSARLATLAFARRNYTVEVLSPGAATGRFDEELSWQSEIRDEFLDTRAILLESRPPLAHHVVMRMRALGRPIVVVREGATELKQALRDHAGTYRLEAKSGAVTLLPSRDDIRIETPTRLSMPPIPADGLGPKSRHLVWLASHPRLRDRIAPFVTVPASVAEGSGENGAWFGRIAEQFAGERLHVRSDFDVEDGEEWNAAGLFHSVPFVASEAEELKKAIASVVGSWVDAPLAPVYGRHPREDGHRPKVVLSVSREAVLSGVMLIDAERTIVELARGTGGVVGDSAAAETWFVPAGEGAVLTALAAHEIHRLLSEAGRGALTEILGPLREHLLHEGSKWEVEYGVDAQDGVWIHQARKAF